MKFMRLPIPAYLRGLENLCETILNDMPHEPPNFPENYTVIEVGCHIGESTRILLDCLKPSILYAVDFWHGGYDARDGLSNDYDMDYEAEFDKYIIEAYKNTNRKVIKFKMTSSEAAQRFMLFPGSFDGKVADFVYLDATHTKEAVKADIINYLPLIKPGGFIGGHDYTDPYFPGVKEAVDEMFGKPNYVFEDTSWLKRIING